MPNDWDFYGFFYKKTHKNPQVQQVPRATPGSTFMRANCVLTADIAKNAVCGFFAAS
jgi:hypothetical protein